MTEFSLEIMGHTDPALVEEVELLKPRRRTPRFRAAVLAACVCLALVGTAFAANPEAVAALVQRLTVHIFPQAEEPGYDVASRTMTKYPLSAFSDELLAASEARLGPGAPVQLTFDTFDEVRAFLGDVPILWPKGGEGWHGSYGYEVILFHTQTDRLWGVEVHSFDQEAQAEVSVIIRTENWPGEEASANLHGTDGSYTQLESYSMPNGNLAEMIQYTGPEKYPTANCSGYFMKDGILYEAITYGSVPTVEDTQSRLKAIIDSFS